MANSLDSSNILAQRLSHYNASKTYSQIKDNNERKKALNEWNAPFFLSELLYNASLTRPPLKKLDILELAEIFNKKGITTLAEKLEIPMEDYFKINDSERNIDVDVFEKKFLLRFIFEMAFVPENVTRLIYSHDYTRPINPILGFFRLIKRRTYNMSPWGFNILKLDAKLIYDNHKKLYPRTPSWRNLVSKKIFKLNNKFINFGYDDAEGSSLWQACAAQVAALLWTQKSYNNQKSIIEWLQKVEWLADWFHAPGYLDENSRIKLLSALTNLVLKEKHLNSFPQDLYLPLNDIVETNTNLPIIRNYWKKSFPSRPFERFIWWNEWVDLTEKYNGDLFSDGLYWINTIIKSIVCYDNIETKNCTFEFIQKLYRNSGNQPYLSRIIPETIRDLRPSVASWFLCELDSVALGLELIRTSKQLKPEWNNNLSEDDNNLSINMQFNFLAHNIASKILIVKKQHEFPEEKALTIMEILYFLADKAVTEELRIQHNNVRDKNMSLQKILEFTLNWISELKYTYINYWNGQIPYIIDEESSALFRILSNYTEQEFSNKKSYGLPRPSLDLLLWLFTELEKRKNQAMNFSRKIDLKTIAFQIVAIYCRSICDEKRDWIFYNENIPNGPWDEVTFYLMENDENQLNELITIQDKFKLIAEKIGTSPNLESQMLTSNSEYSDWHNKSNNLIYKIRTHLRLLLIIHFQCIEKIKRINIIRDSYNLKKILEIQIIELVKLFSTDEPDRGQFDIFKREFEHKYSALSLMPLLKQLSIALNTFEPENRIRAVEAIITQTNDIIRFNLLRIHIPCDEVLRLISNKFDSMKIEKIVASINWYPELEYALLTAIESDDQLLTEKLLSYINKIAENNSYIKQEFAIVEFRTKLWLAWKNKKMEDIESLEIPDIKRKRPHLDDPYKTWRKILIDEKDMYAALILSISNPKSSLMILDRLIKSNQSDERLIINKYYVQLLIAEQCQDDNLRKKVLEQAWDDWNYALKNINNVSEFLHNPAGAYNHILGLSFANKKYDAINFYDSLPLSLRSDPEILKLMITTIKDSQYAGIGKLILENAKKYHYHLNKFRDFFDKLETSVDNSSSADKITLTNKGIESSLAKPIDFRNVLNELRHSQEHTIAKALTDDSIDNIPNTHYWILSEVLSALVRLNKRIEKIKDISENDIIYETTLNEFLQSILEAQLCWLHWSVKDGSSGGKSPNSRNRKNKKSGGSGIRDHEICDAHGRPKTILECLRINKMNESKKNNIYNHLSKIFDYSSPLNDKLFLITFAEINEKDKFNKWYIEIINAYLFPRFLCTDKYQNLSCDNYINIVVGYTIHSFDDFRKIYVYHIIVYL